MTLSEKSLSSLQRDLLDARDKRESLINDHINKGFNSTIVLSLNIAGKNKKPDGSYQLFNWALSEVTKVLNDKKVFVKEDSAGFFAIFTSDKYPIDIKKELVKIEESTISARLLDLDVYDNTGVQIGRSKIGKNERACIICGEEAKVCIRTKRHETSSLIAKTKEILQEFKEEQLLPKI